LSGPESHVFLFAGSGIVTEQRKIENALHLKTSIFPPELSLCSTGWHPHNPTVGMVEKVKTLERVEKVEAAKMVNTVERW
jgi:hypothetical protein